MPFSRPTLQELITRVEFDLTSRLQIVGALARRAMVRVLGRVWAGSVHSLHGHLEWISKQMLAITADADQLERFGAELAVNRKPAAWAEGDVTFTGSNGTIIPAGTLVQRQDGAQYETQANATIALGTVTTDVRAILAGINGNADAGTNLSLVSPIVGIQSTATVAVGGITGGIDTETNDDYRGRILARKRRPPQGGAESDYENWTLEVSGVTRAWIYANHTGLGKVGITFVLDNEEDIIPDGPKVDEVQAYLVDRTRKPITAQIIVFAPVAVELDLEIALNPNTLDVQNAVRAELADLLFRDGGPGETIRVSRIGEAISVAAGEDHHDLLSPTADVQHDATEIPVLGDITFTTDP